MIYTASRVRLYVGCVVVSLSGSGGEVKATFLKATIKIWFNSQSTSRNFRNVIEIVQEGNSALIRTDEGNQHLINMANVNLIEEIREVKLK